MRLRKVFQCFILVLSCFVLSACTEKKKLDEKTALIMQEKSISVSEEEFKEIKEFMNYFMVFPVIRDFDHCLKDFEDTH
ncbi:MAG: hypothetical protein IKO41_08870 [Lachnospiraceae bacterium]|nr:hypothetical protein [Lachnospiraceae bacterium]